MFLIHQNWLCLLKNHVPLQSMLLGKSFVQVSYLVLQYCIVTNNGNLLCHIVVDVGAFERLLGPCMDIMKRNIEGYEQQLMELFGTSLDLSELRQ